MALSAVNILMAFILYLANMLDFFMLYRDINKILALTKKYFKRFEGFKL